MDEDERVARELRWRGESDRRGEADVERRARGAMTMERDDGRRRAAGGERCVRSAARQDEQIMAGEGVAISMLHAGAKREEGQLGGQLVLWKRRRRQRRGCGGEVLTLNGDDGTSDVSVDEGKVENYSAAGAFHWGPRAGGFGRHWNRCGRCAARRQWRAQGRPGICRRSGRRVGRRAGRRMVPLHAVRDNFRRGQCAVEGRENGTILENELEPDQTCPNRRDA